MDESSSLGVGVCPSVPGMSLFVSGVSNLINMNVNMNVYAVTVGKTLMAADKAAAGTAAAGTVAAGTVAAGTNAIESSAPATTTTEVAVATTTTTTMVINLNRPGLCSSFSLAPLFNFNIQTSISLFNKPTNKKTYLKCFIFL